HPSTQAERTKFRIAPLNLTKGLKFLIQFLVKIVIVLLRLEIVPEQTLKASLKIIMTIESPLDLLTVLVSSLRSLVGWLFYKSPFNLNSSELQSTSPSTEAEPSTS